MKKKRRIFLRRLARLAGFEPTACRLGGGRSILLSYGNIYSLFSIMPHSRDSAFAHLGGGRSILLSYGDMVVWAIP